MLVHYGGIVGNQPDRSGVVRCAVLPLDGVDCREIVFGSVLTHHDHLSQSVAFETLRPDRVVTLLPWNVYLCRIPNILRSLVVVPVVHAQCDQVTSYYGTQ